MQKLTTSGFICLEDDYKFIYKIAKIDYEEWEDGSFTYAFKPFYAVIDMLPSRLFQGIPGLDLSLKKPLYERKNIVPTFISERTPSENREDLWTLLDEAGMQSLNRLEWLMRSRKKYSGDRLFVVPCEGHETVSYQTKSMYDLVKKSDTINKKLLQIICLGDYLYTDEIVIDDDTRNCYYRLLMPMYVKDFETAKAKRKSGIEKAKLQKVYKGRLRIKIDPLLFDRVEKDYSRKEMSVDEASLALGVSKSTFLRRMKEVDNR